MARSPAISLFLPSLRGGGAERVMVSLANGFAERGLNVDLVLANAVGPYLTDVDPTVRVIDLESERVSRSLPRLINYIKREQPPALLSALNHANVIAWLAVAASRTGTRLVVSEHNSLSRTLALEGKKSAIFLKAMSWMYSRSDKVIAVSQGVEEDLKKILSIRSEKIKTIYNPIVNDTLLQRAQEPASGFPDGTVIVAVGRLTRQKDYPTLLRAFSLLEADPKTTLVILGEGELRSSLEHLALDLGISNRVMMPGFIANPYPWMRRAHLFVMSSAWEGLPTVLVEAMACGTAVVSTDCPSGPAEILEGGKWGRLVEVGNVEALAQAMKDTLKSDPADVQQRASQFAAHIAIKKYLDVLVTN